VAMRPDQYQTGARQGKSRDLVKPLDKFKVPAQEKNELLGALAGMKGQIVGQ